MGAELFVHRAIEIRKKWKVEGILQLEFLLPIQRIGADTYALCSKLFELGSKVTKVAAFLRSKRSLGLGIEEQDDGPISQE